MIKLIIRKNGEYYQVGYNKESKWVNFAHLGRPEQIIINHLLVCELLNQNTNYPNIPTLVNDIKAKLSLKLNETYQNEEHPKEDNI